MSEISISPAPRRHQHVFLGAEHAGERTPDLAVIWLCGAMMIAEIVGGLLFGSIALVADGLHMTHPCRRSAARGARLHLGAPARR